MTAHFMCARGEIVAMSHDEGGKNGRGSDDKDSHGGLEKKESKIQKHSVGL